MNHSALSKINTLSWVQSLVICFLIIFVGLAANYFALSHSAPDPLVVGGATPKQAADAVGTAISAIDTMLNVSMHVMAFFGIVLATIAIFGWKYLTDTAKSQANKVATESFDSYINTEAFRDLFAKELERAVKDHLRNESVLKSLQEETQSPDEEDPFPEPPEAKL